MNKPCGIKRRIAAYFAVILFAWLLALPAFADGKVFPAKAYPAEVKIPDQSALLIWSNGVERLVIETRFIGEGTNFAWVVPLPAPPEIEPATTGLFPTLRTCLQPEVRHSVLNFWAVAMFACGLGWLLGTVRDTGEPTVLDIIGSLATAAGLGFMIRFGEGSLIVMFAIFFILLYLVRRVRSGQEGVVGIVAGLALILLLGSMLLPALGTAGRATASSKSGIDILERKVVGVFDTTVISAKNPKALLGWLGENGFAVDKRTEPIVEQHVRDGWVFVAAKVHRESAGVGPATPHPLSFTFKAPQPIYPLRLTAAGSDRLELQLFVVGPGRAEIQGFTAVECRRLRQADNAKSVLIGHGLFGQWVAGAPVVTKLTALFGPKEMTHDATVTWREFAERRDRVYSRQGAFRTVANWCLSPLCLLVVIVGFLMYQGRITSTTVLRCLAGGGGALVLAGIIAYAALPKVEVRLERFARQRALSELKHHVLKVADSLPKQQMVTLTTVRAAMAEPGYKRFGNLLQGGQIREEDSPGNYTLRESSAGIEVLGYNAVGGAEVVFTFERTPLTEGATAKPAR